MMGKQREIRDLHSSGIDPLPGSLIGDHTFLLSNPPSSIFAPCSERGVLPEALIIHTCDGWGTDFVHSEPTPQIGPHRRDEVPSTVTHIRVIPAETPFCINGWCPQGSSGSRKTRISQNIRTTCSRARNQLDCFQEWVP